MKQCSLAINRSRLERIDKPEILSIRLVQVSSTDLDDFTACIDHFVSFGFATLLSKELLATSILAVQVKANNKKHCRRDDPKSCHERPGQDILRAIL